MMAPWPDEDFVCERCGLAYPGMPVGAAVELIRTVPGQAVALAGDLPERSLRERGVAGSWSVLEYLFHLRDVHETYTIRLHRARQEQGPTLEPMFNDLRAARFRYNELPFSGVFAELAASVAGFLEEASATSGAEWSGTVRRRAGEERTALWLLRQVAHEGRHHLADIRDAAHRPA